MGEVLRRRILSASAFVLATFLASEVNATGYYVNSQDGLDSDNGASSETPWKTLSKVSDQTFQPGDSIRFKCGSSYTGCVSIKGDGTESDPITITDYGTGDAPSFTNPDNANNNGNAMQIRGDYHIVEKLFFHYCAPSPRGNFESVWSVGALHVSPGNDHVVVRNNEFSHNAKAIQSYSEHSLITRNYIHHGNEMQANGFLSSPYWGPIGIHMGIGNQEVSYNTIERMYVAGGAFGGDGGALEIDDGRNHKTNFHIHHNITEYNFGFLEISWGADIARRAVDSVSIHHNVSRDYQDFILGWAMASNTNLVNNTIIRTDPFQGVNDWVFAFSFGGYSYSRNIIVVHGDLGHAVIDCPVRDQIEHYDNVYWNVDGGYINLGTALGPGEIVADPLFVDYEGRDYHPAPESQYHEWGAYDDTRDTLTTGIYTERESYGPSPELSRFHDRIRLTWADDVPVEFRICNLQGKLLRRYGTEQIAQNGCRNVFCLDLAGPGNALSNGVYVFQVVGKQKKLLKSFLHRYLTPAIRTFQ